MVSLECSLFRMFRADSLQRKFPLHSGCQAVPHSPEPSAICSPKTDIARDAKTLCLFGQSACGCLYIEVSYQWWLGERTDTALDQSLFSNPYTCFWSGLGILEVLQRGRRPWQQQAGPRRLSCLRGGESVRKTGSTISSTLVGIWTCQQGYRWERGSSLPSSSHLPSLRQIPRGRLPGERGECFRFLSGVD